MEALKLYEGYLLDEETVAEIEEAFPGHESDPVFTEMVVPGEWMPSDEDEATVDRYLRALRYFRGERDRVQTAVKEERERLQAAMMAEEERLVEWETKHSRKAVRGIAFLEYRLRLFSESVGRTKRVSPAGTLSWRKGSHSVEIADPEAFCEKHAGTELVRVKAEPNRTAIKQHATATGEIPEGADIVRGPDTFKITTEGS